MDTPLPGPAKANSDAADAICFSAGLGGVAFAAGVIHAYLAADRTPPKVAAGISAGALSAAAIQRCYHELHEARSKKHHPELVETARWEWFRRYVSSLVSRPFDVIWDSIPDTSDFLADLPPPFDPALPQGLDGRPLPVWEQRETDARRSIHVTVKLGRWLGHLRVSVRFLARLVVNYVRYKERYPNSRFYWLLTRLVLFIGIPLLTFRVALHTARHPQLFPEWQFTVKDKNEAVPRGWFFRPLFGWINWFLALAYCCLVILPWVGPAFRLVLLLADRAPAVARPLLIRIVDPLLSSWLWVLDHLSRGVQHILSGVGSLLSHAFDLLLLMLPAVRPAWSLFLGMLLLLPKLLLSLLTLAYRGLLLVWAMLPARLVSAVQYFWGVLTSAVLYCWVHPYQTLSVLLFLSPLVFIGVRRLTGWLLAAAGSLFWRAVFSLGLIGPALDLRSWTRKRRKGLRASVARVIRRPAKWLRAGVNKLQQTSAYHAVSSSVGGVRRNPSRQLNPTGPTRAGKLMAPLKWIVAILGDLLGNFLRIVSGVIEYGVAFEAARGIVINLGIEKALLRDYHLRIRLHRLFQDSRGEDPVLAANPETPVTTLLVAAPLQILPSQGARGDEEPRPIQLWAKPGKIGVADALRSCLAQPPLFDPIHVKSRDLDTWYTSEANPNQDRNSMKLPSRLDLVDGSAVRHNPLPALFSFLSSDDGAVAARALSARPGSLAGARKAPSVHLVYNTPIVYKPNPPIDLSDPADEEPPLPNIVQAATKAKQLARRRDSRVEVNRTNFTSDLQLVCHDVAAGSQALPIYVDEIAPASELQVANSLKPTETEVLTHMAVGCRQTLGLLYQNELKQAPVCCSHFLAKVSHGKRPIDPVLPGLSEVCRHCTRLLEPPTPTGSVLSEHFRQRKDLVEKFSMLALHDVRPRIVFLASGGVFRGSFHIGMLGALAASNIKPDLIAGASVGSLMGAVLGGMFSRDPSSKQASYGVALNLLGQITNVFTHVDEQVALTKTLKNASKDLGRRAGLVDLSPKELRRMVARGSKADPGLAATGAPPALIDAISDMFIIPYRKTAAIAAHFVAGETANAANMFWKRVEAHTLDRLGIRDAVIGSSLIEQQIRRLFAGIDLRSAQPFLKADIAFVAMAVNLTTERPSILCAESAEMENGFDFLEATLASSAFPAAFAPRRESAVYPSSGRRDVFFGDGGMFDNLPFVPAIEVIAAAQTEYIRDRCKQNPDFWRQSLSRRSSQPDLFLVGALNAQVRAERSKYDTIWEIRRRAKALQDNDKIYGFQKSSKKIGGLLSAIVKSGSLDRGDEDRQSLLDGVVNAGVLAVYPSDLDHLNGTFEFCSSMRLDQRRLAGSIGDGCFQTLYTLASAQRGDGSDPANCSVQKLCEIGRVPKIEATSRPGRGDGICPFFSSSAKPTTGFGEESQPKQAAGIFQCPFHLAAQASHSDARVAKACRAVYEACREDLAHWSTLKAASQASSTVAAAIR